MQVIINQCPKRFPQALKSMIMCMGFEYIGSEQLGDEQVILNFEPSEELPLLKCQNCGFTTRSVFSFHEHYENDPTGDCDDVHY